MASDKTSGEEKMTYLHELFLELRAQHKENELRHKALIRALAKNGILIQKEVDNELDELLEVHRKGIDLPDDEMI